MPIHVVGIFFFHFISLSVQDFKLCLAATCGLLCLVHLTQKWGKLIFLSNNILLTLPCDSQSAFGSFPLDVLHGQISCFGS